MWRNLKLPTSGICVMWRNFRFFHIYHYSLTKIDNVYSLWSFVAFYAISFCKNHFLQITLFCREICFVAIYAFLCGKKFSPKLFMWRKNDKYQVCVDGFITKVLQILPGNSFSLMIHKTNDLLHHHHHRSCHLKIDVFSRCVDLQIVKTGQNKPCP